MPLFDHFGLLAPVYEKFIPPPTTDRLAELLYIDEGLRLLDAGGGTGRVSGVLRDSFEEVLVADLSHEMLTKAREKGMITVQTHSEALPLLGGQFDRIIMIDALHHVYDQAETATELFRVLAPGGILIIEEPNFERFTVKILAALERAALMRSRFLTPKQIANLFPGSSRSVDIQRDGHTSWIIVRKLP